MVAEERVVIHVEIDADISDDIARINAQLRTIGTGARRSETDMRGMRGEMDKTSRSARTMAREYDQVDRRTNRLARSGRGLRRSIRDVGRAFARLLGLFTKISFVAMALEIGLVSAALIGVKLAMMTGRFAVSAYQASLVGLAGVAGGVAIALGTAAAAVRELAEVNLAPMVGGMRSAARVVRSLAGDRSLGFFGAEALTTAAGTLAAGGIDPRQTSYNATLRRLGDYAQSGDQLNALAQMYVASRAGLDEAAVAELAGMNPVFASAIAELKGRNLTGARAREFASEQRLSSKEFDRLFSGELSATDPFEGQLDRMADTLVGRLKSFILRIGNVFADFGEPFLGVFKGVLVDVERIIRSALIRIHRTVTNFGLDSFLPGLLSGFEKLANWMVDIVNEHLPKLEGFGERLMSWGDAVRGWFIDVARVLAPLEAGADVVLKLFGPAFKAVFDGERGIGSLMKDFSENLVDNEGKITVLGESLGNLVGSIMDLFREGNRAFTENADTIADFIDVLAVKVVPAFGEILSFFKTLTFEILPPLGSALGVIADILGSIASVLKTITENSGGLMGLAATIGLLGLGGSKLGLGRALFGRRGRYGMRGTPGLLGLAMAGGGMRGAGARALLGTGLIVGGQAGAHYIGSNVAGSGGVWGGIGAGVAGGATGGAAIGAGIGSLFGPGPGTAIGAGIGAVAGGTLGGLGGAYQAISGQRATKKAQKEAAFSIIEGIITTMEQELAMGRGLDAIENAGEAYQDALMNVDDIARQYGVDRVKLEEYLTSEVVRLDRERMQSAESLNTNMRKLAEFSGLTKDEVGDLANVLGVDLSGSLNMLHSQAVALGFGIPWEDQRNPMFVAGVMEEAIVRSFFGPGSRLHRAQEVEESVEAGKSVNAAAAEIATILRSGGEANYDLYYQAAEGAMAAITKAHPNLEGTQLLSATEQYFQNLDRAHGSNLEEYFTSTLQMARVQLEEERENLLKNFRAAFDERMHSVFPDKSIDEIEAEWKEIEDTLNATPVHLWDEKFTQLTNGFQNRVVEAEAGLARFTTALNTFVRNIPFVGAFFGGPTGNPYSGGPRGSGADPTEILPPRWVGDSSGGANSALGGGGSSVGGGLYGTSYAPAPRMRGASASGTTYAPNWQVNVTSNKADGDAVAQAVMRRVDERERDRYERT